MGINRPTCSAVVAGLMLAGAWNAAPAFAGVGTLDAGPQGVRVTRLQANGPRHVALVQRPIVDPALMVSRELSAQPVHEHLAEMNVGHVRVLFDPAVNYQVKPEGELDDNHSLVVAARLARNANHTGVQVLRAPDPDRDAVANMPRPFMIMTKPAAPVVPRFVPETPAPPKQTPRLIAAR